MEVLTQLRDTVGSLGSRSRQLTEDAGTRLAAVTRRWDELESAEQVQIEAAIDEATKVHQAAHEALEARIHQRRQRLQRAHRTARRAALDRIEAEEGLQKFRVQKGMLDTDREERASLERNEARYHEIDLRLGEQRTRLNALQRRARASFRGFPWLRRALRHAPEPQPTLSTTDPEPTLQTAEIQLGQATGALQTFHRNPLASVFRILPPEVLILATVLAAATGMWLLPAIGRAGWSPWEALRAVGPFALGSLIVYILASVSGRSQGILAAEALSRADALHAAAARQAAEQRDTERQRIQAEARLRRAGLSAHWDRSLLEGSRQREEVPTRCAEKFGRVSEQFERVTAARRVRQAGAWESQLETLRREAAERRAPQTLERERQRERVHAELQSQETALSEEWSRRIVPIFDRLRVARETVAREFPNWESVHWDQWTPPASVTDGIPFGSLDVDVEQLCGGLPDHPALSLPGPRHLKVPLMLCYPEAGSLLLETGRAGTTDSHECLNQILLRLLASMPPGRLNITILDPVRLGQSFAGVMHLADFEENLIHHRIWTQSDEIEQRLADLNAHMEKVIQMYLRNEFDTIADFNAQAGSIGEKYHLLVVADFPAAFSDLALKRLVNIATSGARCGVFTLIHRDLRHDLPASVLEPLQHAGVVLTHGESGFTVSGSRLPGVRVTLKPPPGPELMTAFLRQVGAAGLDSGRVRVPFAAVMPEPGQEWSLETTGELRVPIGRTGATKLQYFALGKGTRQHALVAGKTGSGKSTLFHVLINNLALWCSPDQVEFYLVDFKKGVEFSCYATWNLPHARVVAIESDREFGLSVLQKVDDELRRRGGLFRQLGVQDLAGHQRAGGGRPLPRALLLIDEFQEFFVEDDRISQAASVLLDRIVRQGRAFGIHVVLGSQTLGGAYTLARTTLGQMVVRIALQCNEADALLIMDDTNPAPRLLTRPGEGIYNDMAGMVEGNSPFQTVWLEDPERDHLLAEVRERADASGYAARHPFVFEGNAPALVGTNPELQAAIETVPIRPPIAARVWLGAPNSIKGPTTAELHRQSDHNLLIVGQRDEAELALFSVGLLGLAAQYPEGTARFAVLESTGPGSLRQRQLRPVLDALPPSAITGRAADLAGILGTLHEELGRRREETADSAPATFLFIQGLQNFRKLALEDEFGIGADDPRSPAGQFRDLLAHGPAVGIHVIATCDTYQNLVRILGRKALNHFGLRVLFQMSADDSSTLVDTPRAGTLGLHRALLHHGQEGWLETFRPYALPEANWVASVDTALASRLTLPRLPFLDTHPV